MGKILFRGGGNGFSNIGTLRGFMFFCTVGCRLARRNYLTIRWSYFSRTTTPPPPSFVQHDRVCIFLYSFRLTVNMPQAVVVVPRDEEFRRRVAEREAIEGKEIPDNAVLNMKSNFVLPELEETFFSRVFYTELGPLEAHKVIYVLYNKLTS